MERRGIEGGSGKRRCGRREFREEMKRWRRLEGQTDRLKRGGATEAEDNIWRLM